MGLGAYESDLPKKSKFRGDTLGSEICPKNTFTKFMKFNFLRKSVDATVKVRKMEALASRDYCQ